MKFQSFSNQLRPTSKISDYLPSNVIDEIEFNQSKLSQSFNNFAAFNNNHFQQGHVSRNNNYRNRIGMINISQSEYEF